MKYIFVLIIALASCQNPKEGSDINHYSEATIISNPETDASGAFFTEDHQGRAVLAWTEEISDEEGHIVKYAVWNNQLSKFGNPISVNSSAGCRAHTESMNKVAFKADGTVICVFAKRTPTKENRFAGELYYTSSVDEGLSWSKPKFLHVGNTTKGLSRSFFDIAQLDDGEVAAIWLDSRLTKKRGDGSSLFFAKTGKSNQFESDKVIGTSTCECCRTELYVSPQGDIHALYRDIWQDSIRDMSIVSSRDNGSTFSSPQKVVDDNWVINGCPHTGPSIASSQDKLHCIWYTMGGGSGIYTSTSVDAGKSFSKKQLLSATGTHPQVVSLSNGNTVFLWEESSAPEPTHQHGNHTHQINLDLSKDNTTYIKAQIWNEQQPLAEYWVSQNEQIASFAVGKEIATNQLGVAWMNQTTEGKKSIQFRVLGY